MFLRLYAFLALVLSPFLRLYLTRRASQGKEERHRLCERTGIATVKRKAGKLLWVHGVSVGESLSLLSFIHHLAKLYPNIQILFTTGTVTAAHMIHDKLPDNAVHQYLPLDVYTWMDRFLRHWKPDVVVVTESEIWPNLLLLCQIKKIPVYLVNARLTERSFKRWQHVSALARVLFGTFTKILAQSESQAKRLRFFAPTTVGTMPNLKFASKPLDVDKEQYQQLYNLTKHRPTFTAASTHAGEEEIIFKAYKEVLRHFPDALLFLVPRHPQRRDTIIQLMKHHHLSFAQRHMGELPQDHHSIYFMDTLGELGLAYAVSPVALVCGSLIPGIGGHNPIEPAQAGCCVLYGPYRDNAEDICTLLGRDIICVDAETLSTVLVELFSQPDGIKNKGQSIQACVLSQKNNLKQLVQLCAPHLGPPDDAQQGTLKTAEEMFDTQKFSSTRHVL